jgi:hypothetical protein
MCPSCANSELELFTRSDDEFTCLACEVVFDKKGDVIRLAPEKVKKKAKAKVK